MGVTGREFGANKVVGVQEGEGQLGGGAGAGGRGSGARKGLGAGLSVGRRGQSGAGVGVLGQGSWVPLAAPWQGDLRGQGNSPQAAPVDRWSLGLGHSAGWGAGGLCTLLPSELSPTFSQLGGEEWDSDFPLFLWSREQPGWAEECPPFLRLGGEHSVPQQAHPAFPSPVWTSPSKRPVCLSQSPSVPSPSLLYPQGLCPRFPLLSTSSSAHWGESPGWAPLSASEQGEVGAKVLMGRRDDSQGGPMAKEAVQGDGRAGGQQLLQSLGPHPRDGEGMNGGLGMWGCMCDVFSLWHPGP